MYKKQAGKNAAIFNTAEYSTMCSNVHWQKKVISLLITIHHVMLLQVG